MSLQAPFQLDSLPKLPKSRQKVSATFHDGLVFTSVSASALNAYSIAPTPHLVWSEAVSPDTLLCCVHKTAEWLYYASMQKSRCQLHRVSVHVSGDHDNGHVHIDCGSVPVVDMAVWGERVYAVCKDGTVVAFDLNLSGKVFDFKTKFGDVQHVHFLDSSAGPTVTIVAQTAVLSLGLTVDSAFEVSTSSQTLKGPFAFIQNTLFTLSEDDKHKLSLQVWSGPGRTLARTVPLPFDSCSQYSLVHVGRKTLLLSVDRQLALLDTTFDSLLATTTAPEYMQLLTASSSSAVGYTSTGSLLALTLSFGSGTLLAALGKAVAKESEWDCGLVDMVVQRSYNTVADMNRALQEQIRQNQRDNGAFLAELQALRDQGDGAGFEQKLLAHFKRSPGLVPDSQVYEETDRDVDRNLVRRIVGMLYTEDQQAPARFSCENAHIYLLTHPLFPTLDFESLLASLNAHPRLYRQAIVTAPLVSCNDLLQALTYHNDEVVRDVVARLAEEYNLEQIRAGARSPQMRDHLIPCIQRLLRLGVGWDLVACLVDAVGLFSWPQDTLDLLETAVTGQVQALESTGQTLSLIEEGVRKVLPQARVRDVARISNKELKRLQHRAKPPRQGPELISAHDRHHDQVQGLLEFGVADRPLGDLLPQIPAYSVETLLI